MTTNNFFRSDLPGIHYVVQNSMVVFPKEIVIATLREYFEKDSYYHYSRDEFGFPNTPNLTDVPSTAGLADDLTTRLFIGESYRFDKIFYPAIIVRHGGSNYVPISLNREAGRVHWESINVADDLGNVKTFRTPKSFIFAGAWEGSITIDIYTRSLRARDDLVEMIALLFTDIEFDNLQFAGLAIKGVQAGAPSEGDDRNDKLFKQTITLNVRSEWRREIPVSNVVEIITMSIEFGRFDTPNAVAAQNLTINTEQSIVDLLAGI
jgi:hypothetical protein